MWPVACLICNSLECWKNKKFSSDISSFHTRNPTSKYLFSSHRGMNQEIDIQHSIFCKKNVPYFRKDFIICMNFVFELILISKHLTIAIAYWSLYKVFQLKWDYFIQILILSITCKSRNRWKLWPKRSLVTICCITWGLSQVVYYSEFPMCSDT